MTFVFPIEEVLEGSRREVRKEVKTPDIPCDFAASLTWNFQIINPGRRAI
jgi:hypothetical protein